MTTTVKSQTSNTRYFLTIENGKATQCSCPDRIHRSYKPCCKHMAAFDAEVQRAATFQALKEQYDVRSETQRAARRNAYTIEFSLY